MESSKANILARVEKRRRISHLIAMVCKVFVSFSLFANALEWQVLADGIASLAEQSENPEAHGVEGFHLPFEVLRNHMKMF